MRCFFTKLQLVLEVEVEAQLQLQCLVPGKLLSV